VMGAGFGATGMPLNSLFLYLRFILQTKGQGL